MTLRDTTILLALMVLWGLNFSAIQLGVDQINPLMLTALRFAIAVVPLVFFIPRPAVAWRYLAAYGLTFGVGVWGMMTLAMDLGVSPGMAGLLLQLSVISGLLLGRFVLAESIAPARWLGACLAMAGLGLCLLLEDGSVSAKGLGLALVASICWSLMGLVVKRANCPQVFAFGLWGMAFAPLPLLLLAGLWFGPGVWPETVARFNAAALASVLFQAWPTTLLGYWLWNRLIVRYGLAATAPFTLLVTVFGFVGSVLFYQEDFGPIKAIATALILLGLAVGQGWLRLPSRAPLNEVTRAG